ncbi:MAG: 30S ribosomal protein S21 [Rickettsiales bacterium]|jgi:small subunit ribosomal protein S21|nr:30S ribosomal protein S21 [Rickettsiales bacterium]
MVQVLITDQEKFDSATKIFKKKVQREGLVKEARRRTEYEKPSEKAKRKRKESITRNKRKKR